LELSRLGKVGCLHEPLATTNVLPESAGQSNDPRKRLRFYLAARQLQLHYLQKYPLDPVVARVIRERLALILLQHAYEANDPAVAREMHADYLAQGGRSKWRADWLHWGSHSRVRHTIVRPLVKAEAVWRRLKDRSRTIAGTRGEKPLVAPQTASNDRSGTTQRQEIEGIIE
jgi:hypothetical protein